MNTRLSDNRPAGVYGLVSFVQATPMELPDFRPHRLLRNGHLQTIVGTYGGDAEPYSAQTRPVVLPDGDRIILHDDCPHGWGPTDGVVLMLHGLMGCHLSPYMVRVARKLNDRGLRTFRMDARGFGASAAAQHPSHAGRSEDAAAAMERIKSLCPAAPLTLIGFSLGANVTLKLLGEFGARPPDHLHNAVAVAPPIDLARCARELRKWHNKVYDWRFVRALLAHTKQRRRFVESLAAIPPQPRPRCLYEFDDRYTAPLSGFDGVDDYYRRASSIGLLSEISVPTLILAADDDPLVPGRIYTTATLSPTTQLWLTRHGGHLGYIGAAGQDPDRRWMDWRIIDWIAGRWS